ADQKKRWLLRDVQLTGVPPTRSVELRVRAPDAAGATAVATAGEVKVTTAAGVLQAALVPDGRGRGGATVRLRLPPAQAPAAGGRGLRAAPGRTEGSLERRGYRAVASPRPKTASGEDRVKPSALAVHPRDGRLFVASLKTGELLVVRDPAGDGKQARFENYA